MKIYQPMLAKSSTAASGRRPIDLEVLAKQEDWIAQEKVDGIRATIYSDGRHVRIFNRNGVEITHGFPEVARLRLPAVVIDGEIVARDGRFQTVATRDKLRHHGHTDSRKRMALFEHDSPCYFIAFDLLEADGQPLTRLRLKERMALLRGVVGRRRKNIQVVRQSDDLLALWSDVVGAGGEGIIAKRLSSTYLEGARADTWVKFKATQSIACIAVGYEQGKTRELGAVTLAVLDEHTAPQRIGKVGTGWTEVEGDDLLARLRAGTPFVVEVEVLNRTATELRFAVFKGVRTDLTVFQASADQLDAIPFY